MDRITAIYLNRGIELLLLVALWRAYSECRCATDIWLLFARQTELHQIGTITAIAIIARTLLITLREMAVAIGSLGRKMWRAAQGFRGSKPKA